MGITERITKITLIKIVLPQGLNEIGYDIHTGKELIFVSEKYFRPAEVDELLGDSTKARTQLGWNPKYNFDELVKEMVEQDCV